MIITRWGKCLICIEIRLFYRPAVWLRVWVINLSRIYVYWVIKLANVKTRYLMPEILVLVLARIVWLRSLTCYLTSRFYPSSQSGRDIVIYQQQNHKYFDSILILLSGQFGDTGQHISPSLSDQISLSFTSFAITLGLISQCYRRFPV